ncbi:ribonuclease domain-containing protein [Methanosphaera sp. Vir-13MRS]|uniref:ribonuclease domain-containing protein n=1 Tax=Candidatus Methanosphaera massiliense TaxID=3017187 RepID=UPI0023805F69|nr:ribonuclease domain-containing protein [Candidatus Methanosphaera massiliense]MDE4078707.1 ribonuclease domain-containing protein [Candidatus Methanosphaera massiliense]
MDNKILSAIIVIIVIIISSLYGGHIADSNDTGNITGNSTVSVMEDGQYTSMEDVSAYIKKYHKLPSNYITKEEARDLGWTGGSLEPYAPGKSIGGDVFTNRQGILPRSDKKYIECDIDANNTSRGAKRIVYSTDDYRVYYTEDHYNTFTEV